MKDIVVTVRGETTGIVARFPFSNDDEKAAGRKSCEAVIRMHKEARSGHGKDAKSRDHNYAISEVDSLNPADFAKLCQGIRDKDFR